MPRGPAPKRTGRRNERALCERAECPRLGQRAMPTDEQAYSIT